MIDLKFLKANAKKIAAENGKMVRRLKNRPVPGIDEEVELLDQWAFSKINCLSCGNCCKTISPVFKERDIVRLSDHFRLRPGAFVEKYLFMDDEGDYVLKSSPCPFLESDNQCSVYDNRPSACRSYPHTGTLRFSKSMDLFVKNSAVCPAVYEIAEELKKKYGKA